MIDNVNFKPQPDALPLACNGNLNYRLTMFGSKKFRKFQKINK